MREIEKKVYTWAKMALPNEEYDEFNVRVYQSGDPDMLSLIVSFKDEAVKQPVATDCVSSKAVKEMVVQACSFLKGKAKDSENAEVQKKKATFYLDQDAEEQLTEVFINRLKSRNKTDKSALICEALELLHAKDNGNAEHKKVAYDEEFSDEWIRATFIVNKEVNEKLKAIAYWDRFTVKEVLHDALVQYTQGRVVDPIPNRNIL